MKTNDQQGVNKNKLKSIRHVDFWIVSEKRNRDDEGVKVIGF